MPTTIITGRDITFTIDGDDFDAQATSAHLTVDSTINTYQLLQGKSFYTTDTQGTFSVEMLARLGRSIIVVRSTLDSCNKRTKHRIGGCIYSRYRCSLCFQCIANFPNSRRRSSRSTHRHMDNDSRWNTNRNIQLKKEIGSK
jgi:hypothetical protein